MFAEQQDSAVKRAARRLRGLGLGGLAATLLTHGGPLAFWGAQTLYAAAPMLSLFDDGEGVNELAGVLEDPAAARALAGQLAAQPNTPTAGVTQA